MNRGQFGYSDDTTWEMPQTPAQQRPRGLSLSPIPRTARLFVSGLSYDVSNPALKNYFQQFGAINWTQAFPTRGCGYVAFMDPERIRTVLSRSYHILLGREVQVELVTDGHERDVGLADYEGVAPGPGPFMNSQNRRELNRHIEHQRVRNVY